MTKLWEVQKHEFGGFIDTIKQSRFSHLTTLCQSRIQALNDQQQTETIYIEAYIMVQGRAEYVGSFDLAYPPEFNVGRIYLDSQMRDIWVVAPQQRRLVRLDRTGEVLFNKQIEVNILNIKIGSSSVQEEYSAYQEIARVINYQLNPAQETPRFLIETALNHRDYKLGEAYLLDYCPASSKRAKYQELLTAYERPGWFRTPNPQNLWEALKLVD